MIARYLLLLGIQIRQSALLALQYRVDFVVTCLMAVFWTGSALVPLAVLFHVRESVAGWSWSEALVVVGMFTAVKGLLQGIVQPSLGSVVEHLRKGTLDFILLKPADAQFLVSTSRFELARGADVVAGLGIITYGLVRGGHHVTPGGVALMLLLTGGALMILYSLFILVVSLAFRVVKVDNLSHLISTTFDAARWPSSVFRGGFAFFFTFVLPLALMTTYPALALLGKIRPGQIGTALGIAALFLAVSRFAWSRSIGHYTSAGG